MLPPHPEESVIDHLLSRIFGDAVLTRIRRTPTLVSALVVSVLYATGSGLAGRVLIGLPFGFSFSAVLGLFAERIGRVYFSEGHQLYTKWREIRIQVILTFAVFAGVRFILGQALELYPADAFAEIARSGGLVGLFLVKGTSH